MKKITINRFLKNIRKKITQSQCVDFNMNVLTLKWSGLPVYYSIILGRREREVAQSCPTLCDPMDCSLPGSSVHGIFQAIVLEWVAISFFKGSSRPRDRTQVSHIVDRCFTIWATEDTCTLMSISELFTIARTWKKPRWPLADEWIRKLWYIYTVEYSVQFSCSVVSDSLQPHELQHAKPPCPSPTPGVHSNSRPSSRWCHPAISSSVIPFSSCLQSLPASESFQMSQLFAWGGQHTGVSASASFLPKNTQDWSPLEWTAPCSPKDSQESSPTPQFKSINSSALSFLHSPTLTSIHDHRKNHSLD